LKNLDKKKTKSIEGGPGSQHNLSAQMTFNYRIAALMQVSGHLLRRMADL